MGKQRVYYLQTALGGLFSTPLQRHLSALEIDTLVFCGCNFPNCPRATIYEASERDYRIVLVEDAVSGIYEEGRQELRRIGVRIWPTEKVLEELGLGEDGQLRTNLT